MKKLKELNWKENLVVYYVITFVMVLLGQLVGSLLVSLPIGAYFGLKAAAETTDPNAIAKALSDELAARPILSTTMSYFMTIGEWIVCLLFMLRKNNRPMYKTLWTKLKGNNICFFLIGIITGFALNGLCILAAFLHKDISLTFDSINIGGLILVFLCVFVQSSAEEIICRGYLYQKLMKRYKKPVVAILGNSLLFALLHLFNNNVTILSLLNITLSGILFSLMVYYFDSLWCAMAAHAAWNFTQNIIFGLPNSGMLVDFSIYKLDTASAKDSFAYNVGFGVEGTLFAVIVLIIGCGLIYLIGNKRNVSPTDIWAEENIENIDNIDNINNESIQD